MKQKELDKVLANRCEHCGTVIGKVYKSGGTSWCKACWDTLTEEEKS